MWYQVVDWYQGYYARYLSYITRSFLDIYMRSEYHKHMLVLTKCMGYNMSYDMRKLFWYQDA